MRVKSNNVDEIVLRTAKPNDTQFKEWVICRETRASSWQLPFEKRRAPYLVRRSGALWYDILLAIQMDSSPNFG